MSALDSPSSARQLRAAEAATFVGLPAPWATQVFLYEVRAGRYRLLSTLAEATDAGHSCAWNAASTHFACASQDGP